MVISFNLMCTNLHYISNENDKKNFITYMYANMINVTSKHKNNLPCMFIKLFNLYCKFLY